MKRFKTKEQLLEARGEELGVTDWIDVRQPDIDAFATVTRDHAPVHVDPDYAAASPFGGTIAHGLLTLSLGPGFGYELADFTALGQNLNYGYEKVRFPAPLPVNSRVRMRLRLAEVEEVARGLRLKIVQTFEREGGDAPVCVAEGVLYVVT